jgi:two-component system, OmpR family, phosphate regulon response regulator PhoB
MVPVLRDILIVEDDRAIREMIAFALAKAQLQLRFATTCAEARAQIAQRRPQLILLDWMLPDQTGLELARQLKGAGTSRDIPIIMLTARATEGDKIAGLDGGADDYVTKPFSPRELLARINAVLRRKGESEETVLALAGIEMDRGAHRVVVDKTEVILGPTEYRFLEFFLLNPDRVYARGQLLDRIWSGVSDTDERTIDVHIRRLRKALEAVGRDHCIQTVRGTGYLFSSRADKAS